MKIKMICLIQTLVFLEFIFHKVYGWHTVPLMSISILMTDDETSQIILTLMTIISSLCLSLNKANHTSNPESVIPYYISATYILLQTLQLSLSIVVLNYDIDLVVLVELLMYYLLSQCCLVYLYYSIILIIGISCVSCDDYHNFIESYNYYKHELYK